MAEKTIGDVEYRVDELPALEAYDILLEIMRLAGPGADYLPAIMASDEKRISDIAVFAAGAEMINKYGVKAFLELKQKVVAVAQIRRPSGTYDHVDLEGDFTGRLTEAEQLFNFVIEVQFGDFFKGSEASGPVALALILIRNVLLRQK